MRNYSLALLGSGGAGIVTIGQLLLTLAARRGLYGVMSKAYGPQIRGGESAALLRLADHPVFCAPDAYDLVLAVDWRNAERFADEIPLTTSSAVVYDEAGAEAPAFTQVTTKHKTLPLTSLAKSRPTNPLLALAFTIKLWGSKSVDEITHFMAPLSRICMVIARVSTPSTPKIPFFSK